jgi:heme/copper-type cytochrome/quinol oxidase subunit 2
LSGACGWVKMDWDLVLAILLMIAVPGILIFVIFYFWFKQKREEEKITDPRERLELKIRKKLE